MWKPTHPGRFVALVLVGLALGAARGSRSRTTRRDRARARDVLPRITYPGPTEGAARYDPTGSLELTTVRYRQLTPLLALALGSTTPKRSCPPTVVYPTDVPTQVVEQRGVSQMDQSKIAATAVALRAVGRYPKDHDPGALIENVAEQCPAEGELFPGDIITEVDDRRVRSASQASRLFDRIPDDRPLHFVLDVDGQTEHATFTRAPVRPGRTSRSSASR